MSPKTIFKVSLVTTPILIAVMLWHGAALKVAETPMGILNLEFAGTVDKARQIYAAWQPTLVPHAMNNTFIDFLFLLSYGAFLYAACRLASEKSVATWRKLGRWMSRAMIVAAFLDLVENILMFRTLGGSFSKEVVAATYCFAALKFTLVILGLIYILISLVFTRAGNVSNEHAAA